MQNKKGFIIGKTSGITSKHLEILNENQNTKWKKQLTRRKKDRFTKYAKHDDMFWNDLKTTLNSDYILVNKDSVDKDVAYELGAAWATNFIVEILRKNKMLETIEILNKYFVKKKKILAIDPDKKTNKKIYLLASEHGKIIKSLRDVSKITDK